MSAKDSCSCGYTESGCRSNAREEALKVLNEEGEALIKKRIGNSPSVSPSSDEPRASNSRKYLVAFRVVGSLKMDGGVGLSRRIDTIDSIELTWTSTKSIQDVILLVASKYKKDKVTGMNIDKGEFTIIAISDITNL